jgi:peptidoglycan/xylan/chitin deacetylase (PgdA/CDA1 family)
MKRISKEELHSEMLDASQVIEEITQYKPVLFRPPGGYFNHTIVSTANEDHYTVVLWSPNLDTKDWRHPGVGKIVKCVLDNVHNGSIILFHDREKQTTQALEVILPELEKQGYQFVTVSELLRG